MSSLLNVLVNNMHNYMHDYWDIVFLNVEFLNVELRTQINQNPFQHPHVERHKQIKETIVIDYIGYHISFSIVDLTYNESDWKYNYITTKYYLICNRRLKIPQTYDQKYMHTLGLYPQLLHSYNDEPALVIWYHDPFKRSKRYIQAKHWYKNGVKHRIYGPAIIHYDPDGSIKREIWYHNGKMRRTTTYY